MNVKYHVHAIKQYCHMPSPYIHVTHVRTLPCSQNRLGYVYVAQLKNLFVLYGRTPLPHEPQYVVSDELQHPFSQQMLQLTRQLPYKRHDGHVVTFELKSQQIQFLTSHKCNLERRMEYQRAFQRHQKFFHTQPHEQLPRNELDYVSSLHTITLTLIQTS